MSTKHIIHEDEIAAKSLPGRDHKMILSPDTIGSKFMAMGTAFFPPRATAPAHTHPAEEEIIYILTGHGEIFFDGVPEPVKAGSCVYIPVGVEHCIKNDSDETMKLAYIFSPPVKQGSYDKKG